jgi:hypothetical protein
MLQKQDWFDNNFNNMAKAALLQEELNMWREWLQKMGYARARRVACTYFSRVDSSLLALLDSVNELRQRMLWYLRASAAASLIAKVFRHSISDPNCFLARRRLHREWGQMMHELHDVRVQPLQNTSVSHVKMFADCEYGIIASNGDSQTLTFASDKTVHDCIAHLLRLLYDLPIKRFSLDVGVTQATLRGLNNDQQKRLCAMWEPKRPMRWADMI